MSRRSIAYYLLMGSAMALSIIKLAIYARLMSKVEFGLVSIVLSSYSILFYVTSFGVVDGFLKLGSLSGKEAKLHQYVHAILKWGSMLIGSLSLLITTIAIVFFDFQSNLLIIIIGLSLSIFYFNTIEVYYRASQKFVIFAGMLFLKAVIATFLGSIFAYSDMGNLVLGAEIFAFLIVATIFGFSALRPIWHLRSDSLVAFKILVQHGVPLLLINLVKKLSFVVDRWVIAAIFGLASLAQYAFVMLIYLASIGIIGIINASLGPKLLAQYGKNSDIKMLRARVYNLMQKIALSIIPLFIIFYLLYPIFVTYFFPNYASFYTFKSANYIALGMSFFFLNTIYDWLLITTEQSYKLVSINLTTMLIGFIFYLLFYFVWDSPLIAFAILFFCLRLISLFLSIILFEYWYKINKNQ